MYSSIEDVTDSFTGHTRQLKYNLSYNLLSYRSHYYYFPCFSGRSNKKAYAFYSVESTGIFVNYFRHESS